MTTAEQTLAQMVRAKYPGTYDDLSDTDLEAKVKTKFPGVYDDIPTTKAAAPPMSESGGSGMLGTVGDFVAGLGKSAAGVVEGGGKLLRMIPGVDAASKAIGEVTLPFTTTPTNTAQAAGKLTGDVAQFFTPTGVVGKGAKLAEVAKSAGLTMMQGGSPTEAGVSAGLTAALPMGSVAKKLATGFESGAEQTMVRALGPTKEWAKATATELAPEMLTRGVKGSRAQILGQAAKETSAIGKQIGAEVERAAAAGQTVSGDAVRQAIQSASQKLVTEDASGVARAIPGTETVLKRLDKMDRFVASLGPDIPIDKAQRIKQTWDQIVSKAGLYGQKVGASSTDAASAWATREGASAFRKLITTGNPTLEALNKEYAFWKGLKNVLTETEKRTQAQSSGLTATILGGTGATIGALSGDSVGDRIEKAVLGGVAGRQMVRLLSSPAFRTRVSAPMKNMLADALASGNASRAESAFKAMLKALPAQFRAEIETDTEPDR